MLLKEVLTEISIPSLNRPVSGSTCSHDICQFFYTSTFLKVLLVTNIISGYGSLWKGRSWQLPFDIQVEMLYFSSLF